MGLASWLGIGKEIKSAGEGVAAPVAAVGKVLDDLFTSDEEKAAAKIVMTKLQMYPDMMNFELNKIAAQSKSWFNSGWRPFIGWVSGASLAIYFIPQFLMATILWVRVAWGAEQLPAYPELEALNALFELIMGMLGLAALRTVEKFGGRSK